MQTLLITGSGGFVGKNLKEYFQSKYNLLTPRSYELDCTDINAVRKYFKQHKIDLIIHCGSVGGVRGVEDSFDTIDANLKMVENILEAKSLDSKFILFGSGAMYDKSRAIKKVSESDIGKVKPYDLYGQSKLLISEKIKNRKDCVCLNIFACYGKGEKESRFPTYAITQNLKKETIVINQNVIFDYLYIDDLARIVEHFLDREPKNNIINVTPTKSMSLLEIAKIVNELGAFKSEIIMKSSELGNEYTGDNSRLLQEIPDFKFTTYEEGLKNLYNYISSQDS